MKSLRKTKIVGTIGPASENRLEELFNAGLNVTRVNYSHGSWDEQSEKSERIIKLREELDLPIPMLLDMKGPEIRTGKFDSPQVLLEEGQIFTITMKDAMGNKDICTVSYKSLAADVQVEE